MAETRTIATAGTATAGTATLPAQTGRPRVRIEEDASPLVRLIGRTLRDAVRIGHAEDAISGASGEVVVRSHDTPQVATVTFGAEDISVQGGSAAGSDATIVVDLHHRFAPVQQPSGDGVLAGAALLALRPPLPHWRPAAARFWEQTRAIRGIPEVLQVVVDGPDTGEPARFGRGSSTYLMAGSSDLLAGVFTGADDFLVALSSGLRVRGTLSQLSVMTAASWKVRFDV